MPREYIDKWYDFYRFGFYEGMKKYGEALWT
jgi:hypothetical protein